MKIQIMKVIRTAKAIRCSQGTKADQTEGTIISWYKRSVPSAAIAGTETEYSIRDLIADT